MTPLIDILHAYGLKKSVGTCVFSKVTDAAGDHWITVHPNGGGKGQAVLLSKGGEVLGGMGGKFNGMHISSVRGSGDPLTGENVKLQSQKYAAAHPKKERSAHIKIQKGWKSEKPKDLNPTANENFLRITKGDSSFYVPHSEVTLSNKGEVTHMSPELSEWIDKYDERRSAFMKKFRETLKEDYDKTVRLSHNLTSNVYTFWTPEVSKKMNSVEERIAVAFPLHGSTKKRKTKKVEEFKTEEEAREAWHKRRGEIINQLYRLKKAGLL